MSSDEKDASTSAVRTTNAISSVREYGSASRSSESSSENSDDQRLHLHPEEDGSLSNHSSSGDTSRRRKEHSRGSRRHRERHSRSSSPRHRESPHSSRRRMSYRSSYYDSNRRGYRDDRSDYNSRNYRRSDYGSRNFRRDDDRDRWQRGRDWYRGREDSRGGSNEYRDRRRDSYWNYRKSEVDRDRRTAHERSERDNQSDDDRFRRKERVDSSSRKRYDNTEGVGRQSEANYRKSDDSDDHDRGSDHRHRDERKRTSEKEKKQRRESHKKNRQSSDSENEKSDPREKDSSDSSDTEGERRKRTEPKVIRRKSQDSDSDNVSTKNTPAKVGGKQEKELIYSDASESRSKGGSDKENSQIDLKVTGQLRKLEEHALGSDELTKNLKEDSNICSPTDNVSAKETTREDFNKRKNQSLSKLKDSDLENDVENSSNSKLEEGEILSESKMELEQSNRDKKERYVAWEKQDYIDRSNANDNDDTPVRDEIGPPCVAKGDSKRLASNSGSSSESSNSSSSDSSGSASSDSESSSTEDSSSRQSSDESDSSGEEHVDSTKNLPVSTKRVEMKKQGSGSDLDGIPKKNVREGKIHPMKEVAKSNHDESKKKSNQSKKTSSESSASSSSSSSSGSSSSSEDKSDSSSSSESTESDNEEMKEGQKKKHDSPMRGHSHHNKKKELEHGLHSPRKVTPRPSSKQNAGKDEITISQTPASREHITGNHDKKSRDYERESMERQRNKSDESCEEERTNKRRGNFREHSSHREANKEPRHDDQRKPSRGRQQKERDSSFENERDKEPDYRSSRSSPRARASIDRHKQGSQERSRHRRDEEHQIEKRGEQRSRDKHREEMNEDSKLKYDKRVSRREKTDSEDDGQLQERYKDAKDKEDRASKRKKESSEEIGGSRVYKEKKRSDSEEGEMRRSKDEKSKREKHQSAQTRSSRRGSDSEDEKSKREKHQDAQTRSSRRGSDSEDEKSKREKHQGAQTRSSRRGSDSEHDAETRKKEEVDGTHRTSLRKGYDGDSDEKKRRETDYDKRKNRELIEQGEKSRQHALGKGKVSKAQSSDEESHAGSFDASKETNVRHRIGSDSPVVERDRSRRDRHGRNADDGRRSEVYVHGRNDDRNWREDRSRSRRERSEERRQKWDDRGNDRYRRTDDDRRDHDRSGTYRDRRRRDGSEDRERRHDYSRDRNQRWNDYRYRGERTERSSYDEKNQWRKSPEIHYRNSELAKDKNLHKEEDEKQRKEPNMEPSDSSSIEEPDERPPAKKQVTEDRNYLLDKRMQNDHSSSETEMPKGNSQSNDDANESGEVHSDKEVANRTEKRKKHKNSGTGGSSSESNKERKRHKRRSRKKKTAPEPEEQDESDSESDDQQSNKTKHRERKHKRQAKSKHQVSSIVLNSNNNHTGRNSMDWEVSIDRKRSSKRRYSERDDSAEQEHRFRKRARDQFDNNNRYNRYREDKKNMPEEQEDQNQDKSTKLVTDEKAVVQDLLTMKTGGAYIPPAKLRMMQAKITDKTSVEYQRIAWEALKKSINGLVNKVNVSNIGIIVRELFKENIVRGRGLLARSVLQAQAASPTFAHVYAAFVAVINTKFPQTGELILRRLIIQFRRGFRRNDKQACLSSTRFIAHLVNQQVAHEVVALEILTLLLETPTDDSIEVAIGFLKECGMKLTEVSPKGIHAIFERLRSILHDGQHDKRVQYMIEVMFAIRKDGFKDHPAVISELDLIEEAEQFTHLITLEDATNAEEMLNVFKHDLEYEANEEKYKLIKKEIVGDSDGESGSSGSGSESDDEEEDNEDEEGEGAQQIIDKTETNLVALRRTIYLTIQSSLDFEECAHKLLKLELKPGQVVELCHMILDCCAQQRTYEKFFGLLAQRFCQLNKMYAEPFEEIFKNAYDTIHRFETNKLRNVAKFFAHLLFTDAIPWTVLSHIRLNEDETTSSSRIFIKILFQELCEYMGLPKLNDRVKDPTLQEAFDGLFSRDNPRNTRFAINFFTSIGLGGLTDELREHLRSLPKPVAQVAPIVNVEEQRPPNKKGKPGAVGGSSSTSSSSSSSSSESHSNTSGSSESSSSSSGSNSSDSDDEDSDSSSSGESSSTSSSNTTSSSSSSVSSGTKKKQKQKSRRQK